METNEFILSRSDYKSGLFPARLTAVDGQSIVLHSSSVNRSYVVSDQTSPWDLISGKFDEKFVIDCSARELSATLSVPGQEGSFSFSVALKLLVEVLDPLCCLETSPSVLEVKISDRYRSEICNVARNHSVLNANELQNRLLSTLRQEIHGKEQAGFAYLLTDVEVEPDSAAEQYCTHIRNLQDSAYSFELSVPSRNAGYDFRFKADAEIELTDLIRFENKEIKEVKQLLSNLFLRSVQEITTRYSILDYKGLSEDIRLKIEQHSFSDKQITFHLYNTECTLGESSRQCVKHARELEAAMYNIPKNFESADNTFFFKVTIQAEIKITDPDFVSQNSADSVISQIMPRVSSKIGEEARKFSVVDYGEMSHALNRLRESDKFRGNTDHFTYEIIHVECELTEGSRQYASRITSATLDSKATKGEMEAKHVILSAAKEYAKDAPADMLVAIQIKVAKGTISETDAIREYDSYLQECFKNKSENFNMLVERIKYMRDNDLLAPNLANAWMDRAKDMYGNLLQGDEPSGTRALTDGEPEHPYQSVDDSEFSEAEVEDAAQTVSE